MANMVFFTFVISTKAGIQKLGGAAWVLKQVQDDSGAKWSMVNGQRSMAKPEVLRG